MATDTIINHGIRRNFKTIGDRNLETAGTTRYYCGREPLMFLGTVYHVGNALPFDDGTNTYYTKTALAQLRQFWNQGWVYPAT